MTTMQREPWTKVRFDTPAQKKKLEQAAEKRKWSLNRYLIECALAVAETPVQPLVPQGQEVNISQ